MDLYWLALRFLTKRGIIMIIKELDKYLFLFIIGGVTYAVIELALRGWSHWTMFILGGFCFVCLGLINKSVPWEMAMPFQMLIGCGIITFLEFITGCIVNLHLGWEVWDYSYMPLNFLGQISLASSIFWFFLSAVGLMLDDLLRWKFFDEEKPRYKLV